MHRIAAGILAIVCSLAPAPAPAAAAGQGTPADADARAIAAYRLSEATMTKFIAASRGLAAASRASRDTVTDDEEEEASAQTIAGIAAFYDREPAARRALASAGLTSREYVTFMFTLFQAGMAAWLVEQHGWDKRPPDIARENVVFYRRHKAQLDSLTAELKQRGGDPP